MNKPKSWFSVFMVSIILVLFVTAFKPGEDTKPQDPPASAESVIYDATGQTYITGSDNLKTSLFERPYTAGSGSAYQVDEDIAGSYLMRTAQWIFVRIQLSGTAPSGQTGKAYGVELDLNRDGRGELLIAVEKVSADWDNTHAMVWLDANHNVGGTTAISPDNGNSDGYETSLFDHGKGSDPDIVWARLDKQYPNMVDIAFKPVLLQSSNEFLWNVWSWKDLSAVQPGKFDYDDHLTAQEAGSPDKTNPDYPIKSLSELDNTCRAAVGFIPKGTEPGICSQQAIPTPGKSTTPTPGTSATQFVMPPITLVTVTLPAVSNGSGDITVGKPTATMKVVTSSGIVIKPTKPITVQTKVTIKFKPTATQKSGSIQEGKKKLPTFTPTSE